ncbi:enhanced serine sensitivity protein SseB C-terminal domain-containing protein [Pseudomonas sp. NPDC078700]|uniref:enhanced serine sensitivity protein SseB C-terminal domain-containing protein n=1 Tax=Pseudomonas sp. NPDC078700 TaxID=3364424 RepID=UPI0037C60CB6
MSSTFIESGFTEEKLRPSVVTLNLPPLEKALIPICAELAITQAYFVALRSQGDARTPRLMLAIGPATTAVQRRLAAAVSEMLPEDMELDLIELSADAFSDSVRQSCKPFYRCD